MYSSMITGRVSSDHCADGPEKVRGWGQSARLTAYTSAAPACRGGSR